MSDASALIEELADLSHRQWVGWMRYLWRTDSPDQQKRWRRQAGTIYAELPSGEQESDRVEARRTVGVLRRFAAAHGPMALLQAIMAEPVEGVPMCSPAKLAELALRIVNLRRALDAANRSLSEIGALGVLCDELGQPSFAEGRAFWAAVRRVQSEPLATAPVLVPSAYPSGPPPSGAAADKGETDGSETQDNESEAQGEAQGKGEAAGTADAEA
jgi:hypothetical protein